MQGNSSEGWRRGNCSGEGCRVIPQRGGGGGMDEGRGCRVIPQRGGGGGTAERGGVQGNSSEGWRRGNC